MTPILGGRGPLRINSSLNIIVDGNSIYSGNYTAIATLLLSSTPLSGTGATAVNCAASGFNWSTLSGHVSSVSAAYAAGKTNVLVVGETTNSIANGGGRTAAEAWSDCLSYVAAVKATRPDMRIILCGSLPARPAGDGTKNAAMVAWDALALAGYRAAGISRFVNFRATTPFNVTGDVSGDYPTTYWDADQVHPKDAAKTIMCDLMGRAIASLSA